MLAHDCVFPEVEMEEDDPPLLAGMKVLAPCGCGETPHDHMEFLTSLIGEYGRTLTQARPILPLYHWSPTARRKQIIRYGLRPFMRVTTATGKDTESYPVICFADAPSWAWALSGDLSWTPRGEWDLWQTDISRLKDPLIMPGEDRMSGIYEVRTEHRVYKRDLWYVATRTKE